MPVAPVQLADHRPSDDGTRLGATTAWKRDTLRAQAERFHQRKDEGRSVEQLRFELTARRSQLEEIHSGLVNRARQASSADSGGAERAFGADRGDTINEAIRGAQGADSLGARIAELEQELARR